MPTDWLPMKDEPLDTFATQFSTKLSATPTAFNCTAAQATALAALVASYHAALVTAMDPHTRGHSTIFAKQQAKKLLVANLRALARQVQNSQNVTDQQRSDLGLPVHAGPTPVPPPAMAPTIDVLSAVGRVVTIRLHDPANPTKRGKPAKVSGAAIYSFIGAVPPADTNSWTFEGLTGKTTVPIQFPTSVANGAQVWFCAFWFNERKQNGPAASAVSTNLPGGSVTVGS